MKIEVFVGLIHSVVDNIFILVGFINKRVLLGSNMLIGTTPPLWVIVFWEYF
jgi:hypothetical protein